MGNKTVFTVNRSNTSRDLLSQRSHMTDESANRIPALRHQWAVGQSGRGYRFGLVSAEVLLLRTLNMYMYIYILVILVILVE